MNEDYNKVKETEVNNTNNIVELVHLLSSVDINSQDAKLNETTISDGKGGRILL